MQKHRVKFEEVGKQNSTNILEYVTPVNLSTNTLVTIPVTRFNNEVYIGLEIRNLPVPQIHNNNSCIPVIPACRLPKEIKNYKDLENFISKLDILGTRITNFGKLGEKFFPSVGVTPEQVYPYVVTLSEANENLKWVSINELYNNLEIIKDGHLLISIVRLFHSIQ